VDRAAAYRRALWASQDETESEPFDSLTDEFYTTEPTRDED